MRKRIAPEQFAFPVEEIKKGLYSDVYFLRTQEILHRGGWNKRVLVQVFQRNEAMLCGIDETISLLKQCADHAENLKVKALYDGDLIKPWETVLTIEGNLADFILLETVYLGILSRRTKIATNCYNAVQAANGKPVLFFPSRFDEYKVQEGDGYAAKIGGMSNVSTPANGSCWDLEPAGTIPHALIAAYGGDTLSATLAFDEYVDKSISRIALVDFDNDCVNTSLKIARSLGDRLAGVRLDTSDKMVDASLIGQMGHFKPTGVNEQLVRNVRAALDKEGFTHVKIIVSGGFNPARITEFEQKGVPVDVYAVGSNIFARNFDFTADVVLLDGKPCAKAGRCYMPNDRLESVTF